MKSRGYFIISGLILIFIFIILSSGFETLDYSFTDKEIRFSPDKGKINRFYWYQNYLVIRTMDNLLQVYKKDKDYQYKLIRQDTLSSITRHCYIDHYKNTVYCGIDDFVSVYDFVKDSSYTINLNKFDDSSSFLTFPVGFFYNDFIVFQKGYTSFYFLNLKDFSIIDSIKFDCNDTLKFRLCRWHTSFYQEKIYFANRFSKYIYYYDFKTKTKDSIYASSLLIDSIPNKSFKELYSLRYDKLILDSINNKLWRIYLEPGKAGGAVIINLKNNKKSGEFIHTLPYIIDKNYGIVKKDNKLILVRYKYKKTLRFLWKKKHAYTFKPKSQEIKGKCGLTTDSLSSETLNEYIRKFFDINIGDKFIILPVRYSCPSCIEYMATSIQLNKTILQKKNLRCIWIEPAPASYNFEFITDPDMTARDSTGLFYEYFHLDNYNPVLVKADTSGIEYKVYKPNMLQEFLHDVLK